MDETTKEFYSIQQRLGLSLSDFLATPTLETTQSSSDKSFVFVSIDLEYNWKRVTQLGISTFDSETLESAELQMPISNEYPISSVLYSTRVSPYTERRRKPSHFGDKFLLTRETLKPLLTQHLTPRDKQGNLRDVVLVGHDIGNDLKVIGDLCGLKIDHNTALIKAILDTQHLSQSVFQLGQSLSLKNLLIVFKLDYVGLHNAAHDSRYTLRALLFMFYFLAPQQCFGTRTTEGYQDREQRLALIAEIAKFHKPRERIVWCENSPRVKFEGNSDILDRDFDDDGDGDILAGIV